MMNYNVIHHCWKPCGFTRIICYLIIFVLILELSVAEQYSARIHVLVNHGYPITDCILRAKYRMRVYYSVPNKLKYLAVIIAY